MNDCERFAFCMRRVAVCRMSLSLSLLLISNEFRTIFVASVFITTLFCFRTFRVWHLTLMFIYECICLSAFKHSLHLRVRAHAHRLLLPSVSYFGHPDCHPFAHRRCSCTGFQLSSLLVPTSAHCHVMSPSSYWCCCYCHRWWRFKYINFHP